VGQQTVLQNRLTNDEGMSFSLGFFRTIRTKGSIGSDFQS
jgi:hypothetical protein